VGGPPAPAVRVNRARMRRWLGLALVLALAGCQNPPLASSPTLEPATPAASPLPFRVWLHPVQILDTSTVEAPRIADAFTLSLHQYLTESRRFQEVRLPPAHPGPGDLALQLLITRYRAERTEHEMGWWGWWRVAGGPVYVDHAEFAGKLVVVDAEGDLLAEASKHSTASEGVSGYDTKKVFPSAAAERTRFVEGLLDAATKQLAGDGTGP